MESIKVIAPGELSVETLPTPQPAAAEVRVKVGYAGICGSDLHIYHGSHPFVKYPRIIGHEFAGVIDAVGDGVSPNKIGQRVSVDPVVSCGQCYPCSIGRSNICHNLQVVGVHREGGFSEFCCVPERLAYAIPDNIDAPSAAMVEPFSIAANMLNRTGASARDVALVYGAGPIGLTVVQVLKGVYGVRQLIVVDRLESRLQGALDNGADRVVNNSDVELVSWLQEQHIAPTLVIDAACHPAIFAEATQIAAPAGRIGLMGFPAETSSVVQRFLNAKELTVFASRLNNKLFPTVIDWMASGKIQPHKLISHRFDFHAIQQALNLFETNPMACCKVLLQFSEE
jgi:L-gulonate 5-dehydrogenase